MKLKAYYIEDSDADLIGFTEYLNNGKLEIFPTIEMWHNENAIINTYIQTPNDQNKEVLALLLLKENYDLFIIDVKLFSNDNGGKFILDNILKSDKRFVGKKIIILAGTPPADLPVQDGNFQTVTKLKGTVTEIDYLRTSRMLLYTIYNMFGIEDNFIEDLKTNTIGFIRDLFK